MNKQNIPDSLYNLKATKEFTNICKVNIAIEVIQNFQYKRRPSAEIAKAFKTELDTYSCNNYEKTFAMLKSKISSLEKLDPDLCNLTNTKNSIEQCCSDLIAIEIEDIATEILNNLKSQLKKFLCSRNIMEASPSRVEALCDDTLEYLHEKTSFFANLKNKSICLEERANGVYNTLSQREKLNPNDRLGIWNSMKYGSQHKLETEIYLIHTKVLTNLIQYVKIYKSKNNASKKILESIKSCLQRKISIQQPSIAFPTDKVVIDYYTQLQMLQNSTEKVLNLWNKSNCSPENLARILLKNVEPIAHNFTNDFESYFREQKNSA